MAPAESLIPPRPRAPATGSAGFVSVVIPAWNEGETIRELVAEIHRVVDPRADRVEVLVVVPSPDDPTAAPAKAAGARVLVQKRPGYGGALKEGLLASGGDYVVTMDADLSHPPATLATLLDHRDDAEVVIASRYIAGGSADMNSIKRLLSHTLNTIYRRVLSVPLRDMSSGFRIYQRRALEPLTLESEAYDILEEIVVKIYSLGWRVQEIPFDYAPRVAGESHADVVSFTPHFLRTLLRLWRMRNASTAADSDARAFDSPFSPQRPWQRRRFRTVIRMVGDAAPRLDVGCGSSRITQSSPSAIGLDPDPAKLRFLRATNPLLVRGSIHRLPIADGALGAAIVSKVIEYLPYDVRLFAELNRVLRPGGILVIGTPDSSRLRWRAAEWLYRRLLPNSEAFVTRFTRHRLVRDLAGAGFGVVEIRTILGSEVILRCEKREEAPPGRRPALPGYPRPASRRR